MGTEPPPRNRSGSSPSTPHSSLFAPLPSLSVLFLSLSLLAPQVLPAQWGGALGVRIITSSDESVRNSERRGYEGRLYYDMTIAEQYAIRWEMTYTQMQFQRDADTVRFQVAENGFEFVFASTARVSHGPFTGAFATIGPVASFRAACGSHGRWDSNGRVVCDEGKTFLVGYALGGGFRWPTAGRNDYTLEVRYIGNITAAAGGELLAISFGVRRR